MIQMTRVNSCLCRDCAVPAGIAVQSMAKLVCDFGPDRRRRGSHLSDGEQQEVPLRLGIPFERHFEGVYESSLTEMADDGK